MVCATLMAARSAGCSYETLGLNMGVRMYRRMQIFRWTLWLLALVLVPHAGEAWAGRTDAQGSHPPQRIVAVPMAATDASTASAERKQVRFNTSKQGGRMKPKTLTNEPIVVAQWGKLSAYLQRALGDVRVDSFVHPSVWPLTWKIHTQPDTIELTVFVHRARSEAERMYPAKILNAHLSPAPIGSFNYEHDWRAEMNFSFLNIEVFLKIEPRGGIEDRVLSASAHGAFLARLRPVAKQLLVFLQAHVGNSTQLPTLRVEGALPDVVRLGSVVPLKLIVKNIDAHELYLSVPVTIVSEKAREAANERVYRVEFKADTPGPLRLQFKALDEGNMLSTPYVYASTIVRSSTKRVTELQSWPLINYSFRGGKLHSVPEDNADRKIVHVLPLRAGRVVLVELSGPVFTSMMLSASNPVRGAVLLDDRGLTALELNLVQVRLGSTVRELQGDLVVAGEDYTLVLNENIVNVDDAVLEKRALEFVRAAGG